MPKKAEKLAWITINEPGKTTNGFNISGSNILWVHRTKCTQYPCRV